MRGRLGVWIGAALAALVAWAPGAGAVVGGDPAPPRDWPWVVQVAAISDSDGPAACTGVLVAPRWVLTAAHCLRGVRPRLAAVAAPGGSVAGSAVRAVHVHPEAEGVAHDLGLVRLSQPLNGPVAPLASVTGPTRAGRAGVLVGFGWRFDSDPARELRTGFQRIAAPAGGCGGLPQPDGTFCVGGAGDQAAACHGDSGGAFVLDGRVVGVVSGGEEPCRPGAFGIHTDIGAHADWIRDVIGSGTTARSDGRGVIPAAGARSRGR